MKIKMEIKEQKWLRNQKANTNKGKVEAGDKKKHFQGKNDGTSK